MRLVGLRDSRNLLAAVAILNEDLELAPLARRTLDVVGRVLPSDLLTYNEVDLLQRVDHIRVTPDDARLAASG